MKRKSCARLVLGALLVAPFADRRCTATQESSADRIPSCWLCVQSASSRIEVFRRGSSCAWLRRRQNIAIEYRNAAGKTDQASTLCCRTGSSQGGHYCHRWSDRYAWPPRKRRVTIPIVMAQDPDPVGNGFVASLARPGGNITGLSRLAPELSGKQLELLKEIVPKLSRVAVFGTSTEPGNARC